MNYYIPDRGWRSVSPLYNISHVISFTRPSAPLTLHDSFFSQIIVGEGNGRPGDEATTNLASRHY